MIGTPTLFRADNKQVWQHLPLPSGISFLGGDFLLLYRGGMLTRESLLGVAPEPGARLPQTAG